MKTLLAVLALLVLLDAAFAASDPYGSLAGFEKNWTDRNWQAFAVAAVLICIGFNTLVYMLGEAFHVESMKRWAKAEFFQVSASSVMILLAVEVTYGFGVMAFNYVEDHVIGSGSTIVCSGEARSVKGMGGPIAAMECKLQEHINEINKMYNDIYTANLNAERKESTCVILFGTQVWCGSWDMAIHKSVEQAHLLGEKIVPLQIALHAQYALAMYIANNMLSVFLPLGILLRIFPFTRGVGGLFIAIAIGFYIVFPVMYVLFDPSLVRAESTRPSALMQDPDMCFVGFKGSVVVLSDIPTVVRASGALYTEAGSRLAQLTVNILFYPFIALALTLVFIRSAAPLLGGDTGDIMRAVAKLT